MNVDKSSSVSVCMKNASRILEKFADMEEKDYTSSQNKNIIIAIDILERFAGESCDSLIIKDNCSQKANARNCGR